MPMVCIKDEWRKIVQVNDVYEEEINENRKIVHAYVCIKDEWRKIVHVNDVYEEEINENRKITCPWCV